MKLPHDNIEFAETLDLTAADSFYEGVGYRGGSHPGDRLLVARDNQGIVAAVRLCIEEGALVLRGMYVAEGLRGQGLGSILLESASAAIGSDECWCVPYAHLKAFYSRIGFQEEVEATPVFLLERRARYLSNGHEVTVMRRLTR